MKTTARKPATAEGFTLIEVLIASGLLSLQILAVIAMFTSAARMAGFSRRLTVATSLAQSQLERAKNTDYSNLTLLDNAPECYDRDLNTADCTGLHVYQRDTTLAADTPTTGMTEVTVRVSWLDDAGRTHRTQVISGISKF